ncbi:isochorismate synthase [Oligoflexia bacterium]|nr:isochorismate synthase [Oligoflexia bacterium]
MDRYLRSIDVGLIRSDIGEFLSTLTAQRAFGPTVPYLLSQPISPINILSWLASQNEYPKTYWRSRDEQYEVGGCGALVTVSESDVDQIAHCYDRVDEIISAHPQSERLVFLGGSAFAACGSSTGAWNAFPSLSFVLPKTFIVRKGEAYWLLAGTPVSPSDSVDQIFDRSLAALNVLKFDDQRPPAFTPPKIVEFQHVPEYSLWEHNVSDLLKDIKADVVDKVVLARKTDLRVKEQLDPVNFLAALNEISKNSYSFLFAPTCGSAFLSVSPECLFRKSGDLLESEALAGTIPRGKGAQEDNQKGLALLQSRKDLNEHAFVTQNMEPRFLKLVEDRSVSDQIEILKLADVQHLRTKFSGILKKRVTLGEVFSALHPTPAVCGEPGLEAKHIIATLEPFERGWYAGPIGIVSQQVSELAVGIRSLQLAGDRLSLFAGVGIVDGSTARDEWEELEAKIKTPLRLFATPCLEEQREEKEEQKAHVG